MPKKEKFSIDELKGQTGCETFKGNNFWFLWAETQTQYESCTALWGSGGCSEL